MVFEKHTPIQFKNLPLNPVLNNTKFSPKMQGFGEFWNCNVLVIYNLGFFGCLQIFICDFCPVFLQLFDVALKWIIFFSWYITYRKCQSTNVTLFEEYRKTSAGNLFHNLDTLGINFPENWNDLGFFSKTVEGYRMNPLSNLQMLPEVELMRKFLAANSTYFIKLLL